MFVPLEVTEVKLKRQMAAWESNADMYRRRGWLLLRHEGTNVDIGFLAQVRFGQRMLPIMTAAIRLDYADFDLRPPSLTFINGITAEVAPPPVRALDRISPQEVRDALIDGHPRTCLPFLCLPGIREYHNHPQHNGDDWLLHRALGEGDIAVICDRVWRRMVRNVLGMRVGLISLTAGTQAELALLQGDVDPLVGVGPIP